MITVFYCIVQLAAAKSYELVATEGSDLDFDLIQYTMFRESRSGIVLDLPDDAFSATDSYTTASYPEFAAIGAAQESGKYLAWCGSASGDNAITVDLGNSFIVTGVMTQGRGDSTYWVTSYRVETSENGYDWIDQGDFVGNFDKYTIHTRRFEKMVTAGFVKFTVLDHYSSFPCMRIDVLVYEGELYKELDHTH